MAKILILNGSHRQKNTFSILENISQNLSEHDIEIIHVKNYDVKPCIGCEQCLRKGLCHIQDDGDFILQKMIEADGLIIGTPIYLRHIPGYLKNIFDRGCSWYHRSPIVGKPILFATTTQVTGTKNAVKYLKDLSIQWGLIYAGEVSRTLFNLEKALEHKDLKTFNFYLNKENLKKYKPSYKQLFEFDTQKVLAEEILPIDLEFWQEKNYISSPYFFKCNINFFKRFISFLYYKLLKNIISKNKKQTTKNV